MPADVRGVPGQQVLPPRAHGSLLRAHHRTSVQTRPLRLRCPALRTSTSRHQAAWFVTPETPLLLRGEAARGQSLREAGTPRCDHKTLGFLRRPPRYGRRLRTAPRRQEAAPSSLVGNCQLTASPAGPLCPPASRGQSHLFCPNSQPSPPNAS